MPVAKIAYQPDRSALNARFREWHVESLLNQAADLIDKCLEEMGAYNSLDYSWNQFDTELKAQEKELELDLARTEVFQRDVLASQRKKQFLNDSQGQLNDSHFHAKKLYDFTTGENQGHAGWTRAGQGLNEKNVEISSRSMDHDLTDRQVSWATSDSVYSQKKLDIRAEVIRRKRELAAEALAFALNWQRDLIFQRLKRNYEDALDRAYVAEDGLKKIYGYISGSALQPSDQPMEVSITNLAIWIRNSIQWLVAYGQLDQAFSTTVSLRSLLGNAIWDDLEDADDHFSIPIEIPSEWFMNHDNVRLRGIGASLIGKIEKIGITPWKLIVSLPRKAVYRRNGEPHFVEQKLPKCLLGRVENRKSFRQIEICGLISLMNASPIAQPSAEGVNEDDRKWLMEIVRPANSSEKFSDIDDIILEINAVGIPV